MRDTHFALGESIVHSTDQDYREQLSLSLNGEKLRAAGFVPSESLTGLLGILWGWCERASLVQTRVAYLPAVCGF